MLMHFMPNYTLIRTKGSVTFITYHNVLFFHHREMNLIFDRNILKRKMNIMHLYDVYHLK